MNPPYPPLYLAGQTGSGKTSIGIEFAKLLGPAEIINADAFQMYRGMEILSAAPSAEERTARPHHLFGVIDPASECDAATFAKLARACLDEVATRAVPVVIGGSGLYLKALTHGLAPTPKGDPALRSALEAQPLDELVERYKTLDPDGAAVTNLLNRRYVTRNLEICLLTGRPASLLKSEWEIRQPKIRAVYLQREREDIYARINRRTLAMFEDGVLEEVASLDVLSTTAEKAIGLREILAFLRGEMDRQSCITAIQQQTRRYSKRQESWFKRETAFHRLVVSANEEARVTAERIAELFSMRQ